VKGVRSLAWLVASMAGCAAPPQPAGPASPDPGRLDPRVAPTSQTVELELDPREESYRGSVTIELQATARTDAFRFHAQDLVLERVALSAASGPIAVATEPGEDGMVLARTRPPLDPGKYTLAVDFSARFNRQAVGLYRMQQGGESYLFTQFEAMDARKAFPCWDEPPFKIPFRMTLSVPEAHLAVTNSPIESEALEAGRRRLAFRPSKPLPTYLVAIAVGPFDSVPIPGMSIPGRVITPRGQGHLAGLAVEMTPPILAALEAYFGSRYPYEKLDLIAVPEYWPGAMENPGAITYSDSLLLVDPRTAGVAERRSLASVTAHELAHIWFGDYVTLRWWDDLWLNESFASWLGDEIADRLHPAYGIALTNLRQVQRTFASDARPSTRAIRKPVRVRTDVMEGLGLSYDKGQTVLGMVADWIGEAAFRRGVGAYLAAHAWGNAEAADLWHALSDAASVDVGEVLAGFLEQPGHPLVAAEVGPGPVVTLRQRRFLNHGATAEDQTWVFPMRLAYSTGGKRREHAVLLRHEQQTVRLDGDVAWLLPDAGARGYYRWALPGDELLALAARGAAALEPAERVAFLGNAAALLDAGEIGGDVYLKILNAFAGDAEPEVVSALISGLDKVRASFVPDELLPEFARYVRSTLRPAVERFGLERRPGEPDAVTLFRPRLVSWLGGAGRDGAVRGHAANLARSYLGDPASIDPALAGVALSIAAIEGDRERGFETATVPDEREIYLRALGAFEEPEIQAAALAYALGDTVRPTDLFKIPLGFPDTEAAEERVYRWLTANFPRIRGALPPELLPMLPSVAGGCSEQRLAAAREFFAAPENAFEGAERALARLGDQVTDCANLRRREGAVVASYLRQ